MSLHNENYLPEKFGFKMRDFSGPMVTIDFNFDAQQLTHEKRKFINDVNPTVVSKSPTPDEWNRFWNILDSLKVWEWKYAYC